MRSRLEALAAAYLDRHGFAWEYEPICFAGMGGQYLPDFRVLRPGEANVYLEVKPKPNTLETTARQQIQPMSVIWESEPDARLIIVLVTGYPKLISSHLQAIPKLVSLDGTWTSCMRPLKARGG